MLAPTALTRVVVTLHFQNLRVLMRILTSFCPSGFMPCCLRPSGIKYRQQMVKPCVMLTPGCKANRISPATCLLVSPQQQLGSTRPAQLIAMISTFLLPSAVYEVEIGLAVRYVHGPILLYRVTRVLLTGSSTLAVQATH